tara:strand:- start:190 stop:627 length:438 start_codon:yes stop_codon:yes gene_type:complete
MKTKYVIGVDPDCKKSGVATFKDGELMCLDNLSLIDFLDFCSKLRKEVIIVIEDGNQISGLYHRNTNQNKLVQHKISERVGANKQRATDLIEIAKHYGITVIAQKPRKGNWSDKKPMFEKVTGWKKQSNQETRSAAFFGYMYANK